MINKHGSFLVIFLIMHINVNWLVNFVVCFFAGGNTSIHAWMQSGCNIWIGMWVGV